MRGPVPSGGSSGLDLVMKSKLLRIGLLLVGLVSAAVLAGCKKVEADEGAQAPPNPNVVPFADAALFSVDRPEQFPVATAMSQAAAPELVVTGTVNRMRQRNYRVDRGGSLD